MSMKIELNQVIDLIRGQETKSYLDMRLGRYMDDVGLTLEDLEEKVRKLARAEYAKANPPGVGGPIDEL